MAPQICVLVAGGMSDKLTMLWRTGDIWLCWKKLGKTYTSSRSSLPFFAVNTAIRKIRLWFFETQYEYPAISITIKKIGKTGPVGFTESSCKGPSDRSHIGLTDALTTTSCHAGVQVGYLAETRDPHETSRCFMSKVIDFHPFERFMHIYIHFSTLLNIQFEYVYIYINIYAHIQLLKTTHTYIYICIYNIELYGHM